MSMFEGSKTLKPWLMQESGLTDELSILYFLRRYAGGSLKVIHLNIVSRQILMHLHTKCPNLKELSFLSANESPAPVRFSKLLMATNFVDALSLSEGIERLQLTLKGMYVKNAEKIKLSDDLLQRLGIKCIRLKHLYLDDFFITAEGMESFTKRVDLEELCLTDVREDPRKLDSILHSVVDDLTALTTFKLSISKSYMGNVSQFIQYMATKWTRLKHLGLKGGTLCPNDVFQQMASKLPHLQSLELEGSIITNVVISIIAEEFKSLTDLELTNGYYTAQGIKHLIGHCTLSNLSLYQKQLTPSPLWLHAVYDVIATLPSIETVKLTGNRLTELHESEYYVLKTIKTNIRIEIHDSVPNLKRQSFIYPGNNYGRYPARQSVMPMMALDVNW